MPGGQKMAWSGIILFSAQNKSFSCIDMIPPSSNFYVTFQSVKIGDRTHFDHAPVIATSEGALPPLRPRQW